MNRFLTRLILAAAVSTAMPSLGSAQQTPTKPAIPKAAEKADSSGEVRAVTGAILDEIDKHSQLMANLEYLCDMIGPRLTGSAGLTKASHWTLEKFKQYGLSNPHLESWTINRAGREASHRGGSCSRPSNG